MPSMFPTCSGLEPQSFVSTTHQRMLVTLALLERKT